MSDEPRLLYLEPDDEITSVARRLRETDAARVVLVVPGRSRATASAVGLRLLAGIAAEAGRELALVADPTTRSLAAEAGIATFATVAEAISGAVTIPEALAPPRAPIHVVRGDGSEAPMLRATSHTGSSDETMAVRLPPTEPPRRGGRRGEPPHRGRAGWIALAAVLVLAVAVVAAGAALLPGATIRIAAATVAIGPLDYPLDVAIAGRESGELETTLEGTPIGERIELVPAVGVVTFYNYNTVTVAVPQGARVSDSGGVAFITDHLLILPRGRFSGPSDASVGVTAVDGGEGGNVDAGTIDTIEDNTLRAFLAGFPDNFNRLVTNDEATTGGAQVPHTVVLQSDVDALVAEIQADLAGQLASRLGDSDRLYASPPAEETPEIPVPKELVGTEDLESFVLSGTLALDRPYATRSVVEDAARSAFDADADAVPAGMSVVSDSVAVDIGAATATGDALRVSATVRASAVAGIDEDAIRGRVAGLTAHEARTELEDIGEAQVELWPGWVDRVPRLTVRITVLTVAPEPGASPGESPGG